MSDTYTDFLRRKIKMAVGLRTHPKVVRMATMLKADRLRVVVALYEVAGWFESAGTYGKLPGTLDLVDDYLQWPGFAEQMRAAGWIRPNDGVLTLHGFCRVSETRKSLGAAVRGRVLSAGQCAACGSTSGALEVDHIQPIVRCGSSDESNLQALCVPCNRAKGRKTMSEWRP